MSTFRGKIKHFPLISLDRFDGDNLKSEAFLLSHCHEDHMIGLRNPEFTGPLYLSPVSGVFVRKNFPHITQLVELTIGVPVHIKTSLDEIVITSFPANHCPGSIIFLMENHEKRVLYTGDFRLNNKELERITALSEYKATIDEIYLDSTFLSHDYPYFPIQEESCEAVVKLIREWTSKGVRNKILLHTSARYGYEWMFIQLYKALKMKIYVKVSEYDSYRYIPEMDDVITCDNIGTNIHVCNKGVKDCKCNVFSDQDYVRTIRISAMIWRNWTPGNEFVKQDYDNVYRVCYSNHASFNEIRELLLFFKPREVFLNVLPQSRDQCDKMRSTLEEIMSEWDSHDTKCGKLTNSTDSSSKTDTDLQLSFTNISKVGKRRIEMDSKQPPKKIKVFVRKTSGMS